MTIYDYEPSAKVLIAYTAYTAIVIAGIITTALWYYRIRIKTPVKLICGGTVQEITLPCIGERTGWLDLSFWFIDIGFTTIVPTNDLNAAQIVFADSKTAAKYLPKVRVLANRHNSSHPGQLFRTELSDNAIHIWFWRM